MKPSQTAEAEPIHISGRGQLLWSAISGRSQRALCGFNLEGEPYGDVTGTKVCRPCATRAKWTEAEIAAAEQTWSAP